MYMTDREYKIALVGAYLIKREIKRALKRAIAVAAVIAVAVLVNVLAFMFSWGLIGDCLKLDGYVDASVVFSAIIIEIALLVKTASYAGRLVKKIR